jgi:hypothetical protein
MELARLLKDGFVPGFAPGTSAGIRKVREGANREIGVPGKGAAPTPGRGPSGEA